jgi:hypothetical protein
VVDDVTTFEQKLAGCAKKLAGETISAFRVSTMKT